MSLSKTISQYIGTNLTTYVIFLIFATIAALFLFRIFKQTKQKSLKIVFLIFVVGFLGLSFFPYGLFNDTISSVHQIFANVAFLSSLATGVILAIDNRREPRRIVFVVYSATFIVCYLLKFAPFRATELIWETLYFVLFLLTLLSRHSSN